MMVSEPPFSILRAAPKKRLGFCKALASTPPERTLPEAGWTVVAALGETLGLFEDDVGNAYMAVGGFVESGGNDFGIDTALHVGNLLGAFVDEKHHEVDFGVVVSNGVGDLFEEGCFTSFGLSHNKSALTLSNGCEHIDDTGGEGLLGMAGKFEFLFGEERSEGLEGDAVADTFW